MEMEGASTERQSQPPWLLTSHGKNKEKHSFYSLVQNRFHAKSIPQLHNKYICASMYGWLVLVDYSGECCIWNPKSMARIELPDLQNPLYYNKCVLSKPPTDPNCHVLFTSICRFSRAFCQVGEDEFVIDEVDGAKGLDLLATTAYKGQIYGLIYNDWDTDRFVTVHFTDKRLEFRPIMIEEEDGEQQPWDIFRPSRPYITQTYNYMMESPNNNELLLVHQMSSSPFEYNVFDFEVVSLDLSTMEYEELDNIGDRAIFLNQQGVGACCSSTTGITPNCIYYTNSKGRDLFIYDLNDRSKTLLLPCPAARSSQSINFWIEPQVSQKFVK